MISITRDLFSVAGEPGRNLWSKIDAWIMPMSVWQFRYAFSLSLSFSFLSKFIHCYLTASSLRYALTRVKSRLHSWSASLSLSILNPHHNLCLIIRQVESKAKKKPLLTLRIICELRSDTLEQIEVSEVQESRRNITIAHHNNSNNNKRVAYVSSSFLSSLLSQLLFSTLLRSGVQRANEWNINLNLFVRMNEHMWILHQTWEFL